MIDDDNTTSSSLKHQMYHNMDIQILNLNYKINEGKKNLTFSNNIQTVIV